VRAEAKLSKDTVDDPLARLVRAGKLTESAGGIY
jgi:hypothetical protein